MLHTARKNAPCTPEDMGAFIRTQFNLGSDGLTDVSRDTAHKRYCNWSNPPSYQTREITAQDMKLYTSSSTVKWSEMILASITKCKQKTYHV